MKLIWNSGEESNRDYLIPAGEYEAEIVKALERESAFKKSAKNPNGVSLNLQLSVQYGGKSVTLFDWISCTDTDRIKDVLSSAGRPVPHDGLEHFEESQLEGLSVRILVEHVFSKNKNINVAIVKRYLAPKAVIPGMKAAPSKPAKTKVQVDDIPF